MNEGEHKISVVSDVLWCVEVIGGDQGVSGFKYSHYLSSGF